MVKSGRFKKRTRKRNPFRLGQRRVYAVKSLRSRLKYKGSSELRRKTYASKRKAVLLSNEPAVKIYERVGYIVAKKGPGHKCDRACVRAGHWYKHKFTSKAGIYGLKDGTLRIR